MDLQEYIASGMIETCVFGLASPEELREFEKLCALYPALKAARDSLEEMVEKQALDQAVEPPAALKQKIFSAIALGGDPTLEKQDSPLINMDAKQPAIRRWNWLPYVAAASVILLLGSTLLNFYFFKQYKNFSDRYDQLVANQTQMASANQALQTKLENDESALNLIKDPKMAVVKMPGVTANPTSLATVYWDTRSKDVYLLINNLPLPASPDKQYQLWALVDGKPVDAGVFDIQAGLMKMKNIPRAQAFAITLEKRGGSPSPTMEAMFVLGKVTG